MAEYKRSIYLKDIVTLKTTMVVPFCAGTNPPLKVAGKIFEALRAAHPLKYGKMQPFMKEGETLFSVDTNPTLAESCNANAMAAA